MMTPRQRQLLHAVLEAQGTLSPSLTELAELLHCAPASVGLAARKLHRLGYLRYTKGVHRSLSVTPEGVAALTDAKA